MFSRWDRAVPESVCSLDGSLDEIFSKIEKNNYEIITKIIQGKFKKRKQSGKPSSYKRRTPKQSELKNLNASKLYLHNFIRMLSDPYPNAFIKIGKKKIIFKSSKFDGKTLSIEGVIEWTFLFLQHIQMMNQ